MRELCARCMYWEPPRDKEILCDVEGLCRFRPKGEEEHGKRYACLTEACGCCEFYTLNPECEESGDSY